MGFAWFDYLRNHSITILFPFNHLFAFLRRIWHRIQHVTASSREKAVGNKIREARRRGKKEGRLDGIAEVRRFFIASSFNELSVVISMIDVVDHKKREIYKMEDYKA